MSKTILLFMPALFDLHNQVQHALHKLNFEVDYIEDYKGRFSPLDRKSKFKTIKKLYFKYFNPNKKRLLNKNIFNSKKKYDYFLCVNGFSLDKSLIEHLRKINPKIQTILYLYDSINFYDFTNHFSLFDKVYTFDYVDAKKYNLNILPLFWNIVNSPQTSNNKYTYDLFFIGKLHSDRFKILNRIAVDAKQKGLNTYIKIYINPKTLSYFIYRLKYSYFSKMIHKLIGRMLVDNIITYTPIPQNELDRIMADSLCVIDVEIPCQSGLSNRLIQALAMNKKLLTTNITIKETQLYNSSMIAFIERNNPIVPIDFLRISNEKINNIENLRIDNWLKTLLNI